MYLITFFGSSDQAGSFETIKRLRIYGQLHRVFLLGDEENQVHHAPSSFCSVSSASLYSSKSLVFTSASSPYWKSSGLVTNTFRLDYFSIYKHWLGWRANQWRLATSPVRYYRNKERANNALFTESRLFSRRLSDGFLSAFSHQPKISRFPWKKGKRELWINYVIWQWNFSISLKNFEKKNVLLEMSWNIK